jgi:tetratricopeptide (TPR) repeat protein
MKYAALNNLGELAKVQGAFQQALEFTRSALDIALKLGEDWTIIAVYDILGCAFLGLGDDVTAFQCLKQAIQIAFEIESWDLLVAALSHPNILYEYGLKAVGLLSQIGEEPLGEMDAGVLLEDLRRHFDLQLTGF